MEPQNQAIKQSFIDLRSDVLSRAPQEMLVAMSKAQVGDDVFGDDPTTNLFEQSIAKQFNKQAAIFFPSASMGSLAVTIGWCKPGQQIIIWGNSHVIDRQCSNLVMFSGVMTKQLFSENGLFDPAQIDRTIRKKDNQVAYPDTTLVFAQNPSYTGICYPLEQWKQLKQVCTKKNVHLHIDGARIYNAIAHYKCKPEDLSQYYDSMTICLSKSLSCPTGAVVLGDKNFISKLRFIRKSLGGTMRQTGLLTAAGLWAMEHMPKEAQRDNQMALLLGQKLSQFPQFTVDFSGVQTNTINFNVTNASFPHSEYKKYLLQNGIKIKQYNDELKFYRFMTYLQVRQEEVDKIIDATKRFLQEKVRLAIKKD